MNRLDRAKWARRASVVYALGVWTILGSLFYRWRYGDGFAITRTEEDNMSAEEREELLEQRSRERKKRIQELAEDVAEIYTPVEFLG